MLKETIKIADYETEENLNDWENLILMQETTTFTDLISGWIENEAIVKRLSDGKFFKFTYNTTPNSSDELQQEATEVIQKSHLTHYYE